MEDKITVQRIQRAFLLLENKVGQLNYPSFP